MISAVLVYSGTAFSQDTLKKNNADTVKVKAEKKGFHIHGRGLQKEESLNENEFKKAACCTLSESFETTNTVEISNADGISGIRQVEMLGLAGKYVLMTADNIPIIRGLSVLTGLNQIPGPMVSAVNVSKGNGSVSTGFDGLTGGINYALKSDPADPRLFLNGYISNQLRGEGNLIWNKRISKGVYNHSYLHYGGQWRTMDQGGDGMTDMPLTNRLMAADQVNIYRDKYEMVVGVSHLDEKRQGGDIRNFHGEHIHQPLFKFDMAEQKTDAWAKLGIFLNEEGSRSIGQILSLTRHNTTATLNNLRDRKYSGLQQTLHYSAIYQSPDEEKWSTRAGFQMFADWVNESFTDSGTAYEPNRTEWSSGFFGEVVRKTEKMTLLLGLRADYNNLYGWSLIPRIHGKIALSEKRSFHFQSGQGIRSPWVFAENLPLLISSRRLTIEKGNTNGAYGLNRENAINSGISYVHPFIMFGYPATFSADVFYTYFISQVVADRDASPTEIAIKSHSGNNSRMAQLDLMAMPHRRVEIRFSYRYVQTMMQLGGEMRLQPLVSPHRGLVVVSMQNRKKWFLDVIGQVNSPKRLPSTKMLPTEEARADYSPAYVLLNMQVRKTLKKRWEFYAGGENLLNIIQKDPILSAGNPNAAWFDAAHAWGPVNGINIFAGFRMTIK